MSYPFRTPASTTVAAPSLNGCGLPRSFADACRPGFDFRLVSGRPQPAAPEIPAKIV
jgi:hypothetical protein